jgi:hypothetical protein
MTATQPPNQLHWLAITRQRWSVDAVLTWQGGLGLVDLLVCQGLCHTALGRLYRGPVEQHSYNCCIRQGNTPGLRLQV